MPDGSSYSIPSSDAPVCGEKGLIGGMVTTNVTKSRKRKSAGKMKLPSQFAPCCRTGLKSRSLWGRPFPCHWTREYMTSVLSVLQRGVSRYNRRKHHTSLFPRIEFECRKDGKRRRFGVHGKRNVKRQTGISFSLEIYSVEHGEWVPHHDSKQKRQEVQLKEGRRGGGGGMSPGCLLYYRFLFLA